MAADYATIEDLKEHWSDFPAEAVVDASQKLHEASIIIRGTFPDLDQRLAVPLTAGGIHADIPRLVVCRMVKNAMSVADDAPTAGLETFQYAAGPFSMGGKVHNPDGNLFLTAADKRLLAPPRARRKAFTIQPGGGL